MEKLILPPGMTPPAREKVAAASGSPAGGIPGQGMPSPGELMIGSLEVKDASFADAPNELRMVIINGITRATGGQLSPSQKEQLARSELYWAVTNGQTILATLVQKANKIGDLQMVIMGQVIPMPAMQKIAMLYGNQAQLKVQGMVSTLMTTMTMRVLKKGHALLNPQDGSVMVPDATNPDQVKLAIIVPTMLMPIFGAVGGEQFTVTYGVLSDDPSTRLVPEGSFVVATDRTAKKYWMLTPVVTRDAVVVNAARVVASFMKEAGIAPLENAISANSGVTAGHALMGVSA